MFIDAHCHACRKPCAPTKEKPGFMTADQLLQRFDELDIEAGCVLPLIGPEYYCPQTNEDVLEMAEQSGGRVIPFCNIHPRAISNSADAPLGDLLRYYKDQGCRGVGEVTTNVPFTDPMVQNPFKHVQDVGLPLTFHVSDRVDHAYGLVDDPGLPQLEFSLQRFPKLTFLGHSQGFWSEIARLETPYDRAVYPDYPVKEEGVVPKLLRRYENLWGDLSAGSGYNALARDPDHAVLFLNEFQDRLLFANDLCSFKEKARLPAFLLDLRKSGKLSADVFNKIARENARRLFGLAGG